MIRHGIQEGLSRDQMLLLASVGDYVSADNLTWFIAVFIDNLDIDERAFGWRDQGAGRPGYDPADMLKLYLHLYGYFNRVRSRRCLAAEAGRNLGVM